MASLRVIRVVAGEMRGSRPSQELLRMPWRSPGHGEWWWDKLRVVPRLQLDRMQQRAVSLTKLRHDREHSRRQSRSVAQGEPLGSLGHTQFPGPIRHWEEYPLGSRVNGSVA